MINVDVFVPAMNQKYNCNVDEETKISILIEELAELISKKERTDFLGDKSLLSLCGMDQSLIFDVENELKDYSVKNGETLILV